MACSIFTPRRRPDTRLPRSGELRLPPRGWDENLPSYAMAQAMPQRARGQQVRASLRTISPSCMAKLDIVQRNARDECHGDFRAAEPVIEAQGEDDGIGPRIMDVGSSANGSGISPTWAQCSRRLKENLEDG